MAISDIKYIRSSINFTSISTMDEIYNTHSIKVEWNTKVLFDTDITKICLMRAILAPGELADYSQKSVRNKFRTIFTWERENDYDSVPDSVYVDKFVWNDNSDGNLHNLNYNNDADWTEYKFRQAIRRICAGEQAVIYKIFGYSRRMSRGATPIGFFCDGKRVVALSQKNQMIKDKWYSEGGVVWRSSDLDSNKGCYVRVAVDLNRDLGENAKKERRVWASTTKGEIYCFDYWTGRKIGSYNAAAGKPIYALAFDANNNQCVFFDGNNKVVSIKETNDGKINKIAESPPIADFGGKSDRAMGGVCVANRSTGRTRTNFYVIANRETVISFLVTSSAISLIKTIPRTHFGCTITVPGSNEQVFRQKETKPDQNNLYGIGAGVNGQVWTNGHTPITVSSMEIKSSGNPLRVLVRAGTQCRKNGGALSYTGGTTGEGHGRRFVTDYQWNSFTGKDASGGTLTKDNIRHPATPDGGWGNHVVPNRWGMHAQHWGFSVDGRNTDLYSNLCYWTWDYAARQNNDGTRDPDYGRRVGHDAGCKMVWSSLSKAVEHINWALRKYPNIDHRTFTSGLPITTQSLKHLGIHAILSDGADHPNVQTINDIHIEIVDVSEELSEYNIINNAFLQDLNYFYGCTTDENYYDTNGQLEDLQDPANANSKPNYRKSISAASASVPAGSARFTPTTRWNFYDKRKMFGFAGRPYIVDYTKKYGEMPASATPLLPEVFDYLVTKPVPFQMKNGSEAKHDFFVSGTYQFTEEATDGNADHAPKNWCQPGDYNQPLPMSIGSVYPRIPADGRMYISFRDSDYYGAKSETKEIKYELMFADRREGKVGYLQYTRGKTDDGKSPIGSSRGETEHRLVYKPTQNVSDSDETNAYYTVKATQTSDKPSLDLCPYHVVVDSDNNIWFCYSKGIGKIQLLPNSDVNERYVYSKYKGNEGLYPYENENYSIESSLVYLNKHATDGAEYKDSTGQNTINAGGITNGYGGITSEVYDKANELLRTGTFALATNTQINKAFMYNSNEWRDTKKGPWVFPGKLYDAANKSVWKQMYARNVGDLNHTDTEDQKRYGNLNNEFNSDNFGLSCLFQRNEVELGPDIIHPVPLLPTAKSKILEAYSMSNAVICDTNDGSGFWDAKTTIFDYDQQASGYDDLSTKHYIYDIENHYRTLLFHRYVYHDSHIIGTNVRIHDFERDDFENIMNPELVWDNYVDAVWKTPNYVGENATPVYAELSAISSIAPTEQYWVDLYIDYQPSVYNLTIKPGSDVYEVLDVGLHRVHVFERWPTNKFCARGIGGSTTIDVKTDYDLVGRYFWGECHSFPMEASSLSVGKQSKKTPKKKRSRKKSGMAAVSVYDLSTK